ncbi:MAG: phosphatidate cytidylyltransferase [Pseudomonadota bacterium]
MLLARFVSALTAVTAILVVLFVLPARFISPVILVVVTASAWEWGALSRIKNRVARIAYAAFIFVCALAYWWFATPDRFLQVLIAAGVWWAIAAALVLSYPVRVARALVLVGGPITLVSMFAALDGLARFGSDSDSTGPVLLLFVLVVIWAADVGGYFVGKQFGGAKLAPKVSPNKTWAGVLGGLGLSAVVGFAGTVLFPIGWQQIVSLCLVTAAVSILGDLTISLFKREAGLKDSGTLFPGHGGILDRVDSISAGAVLFTSGLVFGHGPW